MTKEKALIKAKEDYWFFREHPDWKNDKDVAVAAVQNNGWNLEYTSNELKNDKEVVLAAVQQDGLALYHASDELKNDREVVLVAVQKDGRALEYASDELKNDKEVVLVAVQKGGRVLEYASDKLKDDKDVVMAAVQQSGSAFVYASDELRKDKETILFAIKNHIMADRFSLLEGYQTFEEIIDKEGEEFLFSCWDNKIGSGRLQVANHPNFLPTLEQIEIGLQDSNQDVQQVYQLRQDEWSAKIEENKLRNTL